MSAKRPPSPTISRETVRRMVQEVASDLLGAPGQETVGERWKLPDRFVAPPRRPRPEGRSAALATDRSPASVLRPRPDGIRVAIGSDHGGFDLKRQLCELLRERGFVPVDVGTDDRKSCDYPDFAWKVGDAVRRGRARWGIMIDGAGIGSAMTLNKMRGIRAATVHNEATAVNSRAHNDANVLVLGAAQMHPGHARRITRIWLETPHAGGRHARRVEKINRLDQGRS